MIHQRDYLHSKTQSYRRWRRTWDCFRMFVVGLIVCVVLAVVVMVGA